MGFDKKERVVAFGFELLFKNLEIVPEKFCLGFINKVCENRL